MCHLNIPQINVFRLVIYLVGEGSGRRGVPRGGYRVVNLGIYLTAPIRL
nr:MAG TPA: hypothetical protein [Caudoviricetes sp.]